MDHSEVIGPLVDIMGGIVDAEGEGYDGVVLDDSAVLDEGVVPDDDTVVDDRVLGNVGEVRTVSIIFFTPSWSVKNACEPL